MPSSIRLKDVTKTYRLSHSQGEDASSVKVAVDSVSLAIGSGERVGIIGRNGAGKTTLLQILSGIIEPTTGEVDVKGRVTCVMTLGVGLREEASGRENIYLDGETLGYSRKEVDRYLDEVVEFAELDQFIDLPVRTYSTGMKSRLSFAMLIAAEPDILIIDEALSAGDIFFAKKASAKMAELTASGKIVIVVSHGLESITDMCERCIWMEAGRVIMDGDAESVTNAYEEQTKDEELEAWQALHLSQNGAWAAESRWCVASAEYFQSDASVAPNRLKTGLLTRLAFEITKPAEIDVQLTYRIEKTDGFCVEEREVATLGAESLQRQTGAIEFQPLLLASGKYLIEIQLRQNGISMARLNSIFEVHAPKHSGGEPVLIAPATIHVKKI